MRIQKYFKWKILSFLMFLVIIFGSLSVTSMADTNPVTESEDEWIGGEDHLSDEEKPAYIQEIEAKRQISDSFEIVALRESNVKHYAMPDGTYQAVVYAYDVHEMDAEGQWVDKFVTSASGSNQSVESNSAADSLLSENAVSDTYIDSGNPDTTHGHDTDLWAGKAQTAYIRFSCPSLPSNAEITNAELNVYYYYYVTSGYVNVGVFQVLTGWGETSLTYNKSDTHGVLSSTAESVSTLVAGSNITQTSPRIKSFNVSNIVKNWYAGESNYGVGLTRVGGQNSVILCSREGSAEYRPSLTITYTLPTLPIVTGNYYVQNSSYETYLTVYEEAFSNHDELFKIEIREFHGGVTQKWHFTYLHNGYYKITSFETGRVLSVQAGKEDESDSDSILKQEVYTASARQQWKITLTSNGNYKIAPKSAEDYTADYCMAGSDSVISGTGINAIRNIEQSVFTMSENSKCEWNIIRMLPTCGSEIAYDASKWAGSVSINNNCYAYAINNQVYPGTNNLWYKQQPGEFYNDYCDTGELYTHSSYATVYEGAILDYDTYNTVFTNSLLFTPIGRYETCPIGSYKVALVASNNDYHWYRQDSDGLWSHKQGTTPVKRTDNSGNLIIDPQIADRGNYTIFVGYYSVQPWGNMYIAENNSDDVVSPMDCNPILDSISSISNSPIPSNLINQIHSGMTVDEVISLIGFEGTDIGSGRLIHCYQLNSGDKLIITYQLLNDKGFCVESAYLEGGSAE